MSMNDARVEHKLINLWSEIMNKKYHYWTPITAFCFERKCRCVNCSEKYFCIKKTTNNDYGMKPVKYAALQTYANMGLKGFDEALYKIGKEKK